MVADADQVWESNVAVWVASSDQTMMSLGADTESQLRACFVVQTVVLFQLHGWFPEAKFGLPLGAITGDTNGWAGGV